MGLSETLFRNGGGDLLQLFVDLLLSKSAAALRGEHRRIGFAGANFIHADAAAGEVEGGAAGDLANGTSASACAAP